MAEGSITLRVKVAPWVKWYIKGIALFSTMTGCEPNLDKVLATVMRGVRVKAGEEGIQDGLE